MVAPANVNILLEPQLLDMLRNLKMEIFRTLNCVKIGSIQAFDSEKQTAQVAILFKRVLADGTLANYPALLDCPVFTLQGGGGSFAFPVNIGDECIVLFSDRNLDNWFQNGTAAAPASARCHDLSDGIAVVGLNSLARSISAYEAGVSKWQFGGAEIRMDGTMLKLSRDGATVIIKNGLITLANPTTNLLTLMNGMIDVLAALTVQQGSSMLPLTAASITALEALKVQFATLLQ